MRSVFLIVFFASSLALRAQQVPEIFGSGLLLKDGVFGFTLSPDGREAFWVESRGGRDTLIIMQSQFLNNKWQPANVAPFSGKSGIWKDIDPVFSPDGKKILFQSNRPSEGKNNAQNDFDIWAVNKMGKGWSAPYRLGNVINTDASESFASISSNGNIYFMKDNPDGHGSSDIYRSEFKNGQYQIPVNVGAPVNTTFRDSNPFISADEDYLIFFSSDSTGFGSVDLYISFMENGRWSAPINLGDQINSVEGEFCPFVHSKQKKLYFARTVTHKNGRRSENIYSVSFDPKNYEAKIKK